MTQSALQIIQHNPHLITHLANITVTTTTTMNHYDFFTNAMLDAAINIPINFNDFQVDPNLDLKSLFTNPAAFTPLEDAIFVAPIKDPVDFNIDNWLNSLPVQSPTPAPELSAPEAQNEDTPSTPSTNMEHTPEQEACCPDYEYMDLHNMIHLPKTHDYHLGFTKSSLEFFQGAPILASDRWDQYEMLEGDEVYQLLCYACKFYGEENLTKWQVEFLLNCVSISPPICPFCDMPKNYWCNHVVTSLKHVS